MINLHNPQELRLEFDEKMLNFNSLHDDMQTYLDGYNYNFYYATRPNMIQSKRSGVNLVQVFADKLWHHTSEFPKINVPSDAEDSDNADIREKIILATHQKNNTEAYWSQWTFDGTVMGMGVARTVFDVEKRCINITRYDPRRCFYQKADSNFNEVEVFWTAIPMTKSAIKRKYGIDNISADAMTFSQLADFDITPSDTHDYYLVVTRDDSDTSVEWVGDKYIKKPYKHLQGGIPIDIAMPYTIASFDHLPAFYLSKLVSLAAEFNEYWRRRGNIVRKLGNPLVYGRGVYKTQEQDIKAELQSDGGFVALKENGELALLSIPETKMIDTSLADCFQRMKDVAGFPTATFGEVVGANTSGDALGMYFTPTQKMVNHYNKAYKSMLQGINAKILRGYDMFGKEGEEFTLNGYMPHGSLRSAGIDEAVKGRGSGYSITFTKEQIDGKYTTVVTPSAVTPKDDIAYKRFILDGVRDKLFSRQYGLDEIGVLSPEDEFKRLQEESQDPFLNPEGTSNVLQNTGPAMEQLGLTPPPDEAQQPVGA